MLPEEYLETIRGESAAISAAFEEGRATEVPSCPGWDVEKVVNHLGRVQRWTTAMVRARSQERLEFPPRPPVVDRQWFDEGVAELIAALEEAGPDVAMYTFPHGGGTSRFWFRRQASEAAVHRWDVDQALTPGAARPIDVEVALAGIDELLDVHLHGRKAHLGGTIHLHATDSPHGEWVLAIDDEGELLVGHGHEKGDVALRATASDLLLWLWGRPLDEAGLEVFGDEAILDQWRAEFSMS